jgi:hypothetical protein
MRHPLVRRTSLAAPLVVAGLVAGCGIGGPPTSAEPGAPASHTPAVEASAPSATPASRSDDPTPIPTAALSEPPVALLLGDAIGREPAVGDLGAYSWGQEGSDAPWIVSKPGMRAKPGVPVSVSFDPPVAPTAWTVRWAPITAAGAGDVVSWAEGSGDVTFAVPGEAGAWSLYLEARFGTGHDANWFWRVDVR